jgi:hypothetical protein
MFQVRGIPVELVDHFWPFAEPYIKRALDHTSGEFLPADVKAFCQQGTVQLWLVSEGSRIVAAITTEIINYPRRRHCRIITLAGSRAAEWTEQADTIISAWAREQGCVALEAFVRKGYVPVLIKQGFTHKYSAVIKPLE